MQFEVGRVLPPTSQSVLFGAQDSVYTFYDYSRVVLNPSSVKFSNILSPKVPLSDENHCFSLKTATNRQVHTSKLLNFAELEFTLYMITLELFLIRVQ